MSKRYYWTNKSVLALAKNSDPISTITEKARKLVLDYIENGGEGPPFDPFKLAKFCRIDIFATDNVRDARTRAHGDRYTIEFNPNRSTARIRYSIAHEISHTLFPDCHEVVRNRATHTEMEKDEWQLEMLCNIAAGEILMPVGSFPELRVEKIPIEHIVDLQKRFEVSIESLLLRFIRLTNEPCILFSSSRKNPDVVNYQVDYAISSNSILNKLKQGTSVPEASGVSDCTAIGYTSKGLELWPDFSEKMSMECVGIPAFPGQLFPRVMGLLRPFGAAAASSSPTSLIKMVRGDATEPRAKGHRIITFIVNDATPNWGAGFALEIKKKWPHIQRMFSSWVLSNPAEFVLGNICSIEIDEKTTAVLMIAQKGYGHSNKPRIRYGSLQSTLLKLATFAQQKEATVHMPRIGSGFAGGNWSIIEEMIVENLSRQGVEVTVYDLSFRQAKAQEHQQSLLFSQS